MADSNGDKPVHWTQTPAGKKKMARLQRKAWKERRAAARSTSGRKPSSKSTHASRRNHVPAARDASASASSNHRIPADLIAYALGHIEGWIEHYARSAGVPSESLTAELGAILYSKGRR